MGGAGERGALDDRGGTIARERESALRGVGLPPAPPLGPMAGVVPAGRRTTAPLGLPSFFPTPSIQARRNSARYHPHKMTLEMCKQFMPSNSDLGHILVK